MNKFESKFIKLFGEPLNFINSYTTLLGHPAFLTCAKLLKATAFFSLTSPKTSMKLSKSLGIFSGKPMQSIKSIIWRFSLRRLRFKNWLNCSSMFSCFVTSVYPTRFIKLEAFSKNNLSDFTSESRILPYSEMRRALRECGMTTVLLWLISMNASSNRRLKPNVKTKF